MKKIFSSFLVVAMLLAGVGMVSNSANAATANDTITANMDVLATLTMTCDDTVTMGAITGVGSSDLATNVASCDIATNNTTGYNLTWAASAATMANATSDTIAAYTPAVADTPETWAVAAADSEWGARLMTTSTDTDVEWGAADTYAGGNWLNVATSAREIVNRATETDQAGSTENIQFGAQVGANKWQPTGTYTVNVVMTATTN